MGAQNELHEMLTHILQFTYGKDTTFRVEMTTPRRRGARRGDKDNDNMYTLHVIKGGQVIAKSEEQPGYNRNYWTGYCYAKFYDTLTNV